MIPRIKFILLIFAALFICPANGYSISVSRLNNPFSEKTNVLSESEKIFVQLDNSIYIPGEKIHYTSWLVNANSNQPEQSGTIIYYELLSYTGKRCMFWRTNSYNGNASGSITIPDSLQGGVYTFRAFTNQMRNNDAAFYYATTILITRLNDNDLSSIPVPLPYNSPPGGIEFYPEGGHLVSNLECKVGVRANIIPSAKMLTGFVKDMNDSLVTSFQTDSCGLAVFSFVPQQNNSYKAYIKTGEGKTNEYSLPPIRSNGFLVQVAQNAGNVSLKIQSAQSTDFENGPYRISLASRGKTVKDTLLWFKNSVIDLSIENNKLVSGISDLKIRDKHNEIVYENLIYLTVDKSKVITVGSLMPVYKPGEIIGLQLQPANPEPQDTMQLSVIVANTNPFPFIGSNTFLKNYLSFFSEIPGSFCFPNFNGGFSIEMANKYLLCVKPDEYFWNRINAQTYCFYPAETKGYVFSGNLLVKEKGEPVSKQKICISAVDSIPSFNFTVTDPAGAFHFLLDQSFDNKDLVLQLIDPPLNNTAYTWEIDNKNDSGFNHPFGIYNFTKTELAYLANFRKIKLINTIYNNNENQLSLSPLIPKKNQFQNFSIIPAYSVFPGDYSEISTFEEITNNILPGVKLKKDDASSSIFIFNPDTKTEMQNPATIFLNGVPIYDIEYIRNLKAKAISRIDVNQSQIMYGDYTFNGILSFATKDRKFPAGDFNAKRKYLRNEVQPNIPASMYGESEVAGNRKEALPDLRYLLYMNQSLKLCGKESDTIRITASNLRESYSVRIQGITDKGQLISELVKFSVKQK